MVKTKVRQKANVIGSRNVEITKMDREGKENGENRVKSLMDMWTVRRRKKISYKSLKLAAVTMQAKRTAGIKNYWYGGTFQNNENFLQYQNNFF